MARWLRSGERIRAAEGHTSGLTGLTGYPQAVAGPVVDSMVGANPTPFWALPNRSAATFGVVAGLDQGGTLRDPDRRLELAVEGGPTWPTFDETRIVAGQYGPDRTQTRIDWTGSGARIGGGLGATWGFVADDAEGAERPAVRVRVGGRLDGAHEQNRLASCEGAACRTSRTHTSWGRVTVPAAVELRVSARVTVSAGLSPYGVVHHGGLRAEGPGDDTEPIGVTDGTMLVGLGARGGVRYEHRGWALAASFGGGSASSGSGLAGVGGMGSPAPALVAPPMPSGLTPAGPGLSIVPLVWIGWRPGAS